MFLKQWQLMLKVSSTKSFNTSTKIHICSSISVQTKICYLAKVKYSDSLSSLMPQTVTHSLTDWQQKNNISDLVVFHSFNLFHQSWFSFHLAVRKYNNCFLSYIASFIWSKMLQSWNLAKESCKHKKNHVTRFWT